MIPKKIHYFWVGGNPKPESVLLCIESWRKYCPDYEIIEWNESNYDFSANEYMSQAYKAKKWAFVTDFARLDVIYRLGGIYLDTDVELIRSLDALLSRKMFLGFEKTTETEHYVATGLGFGAEPGMILLKEMMADYEDRNILDANGAVCFLPCPQVNTEVLRRHGLKNEDRDQTVGDAIIFASDVFCPQMYCSSAVHLTDRTVSIHHYDASWMDGDRKRLHDRNIRLNHLLGDQVGNRTAKFLEDTEYLFRAVKRRIKKD